MSMQQIIDAVQGLHGALVVLPGPGDGTPELAWGDAFFYFAPDGRMPQHTQPYGTIVTKDYPDDTASDLDPDGRVLVSSYPARYRTGDRFDLAGIRLLVAKLTGQRLDKSSRFSDWSHRPLTDRQLTYALADVVPLCKIYEVMERKLASTPHGPG